MDSTARVSRYAAAIELEIKNGNVRNPIWNEALQNTRGDESAAKNFYIAKRVEQMEADENFLASSQTGKIRRENFSDEISDPESSAKHFSSY